jgi:hypothetical protein
MVVFLTGFSILVWYVSDRFLIPGMVAAHDATPGQKRQLQAFSRLLLAIVLVILSVSILLIFRVRRFFFPRKTNPGLPKTEYVDAWTEAGKRARADE